MYRTKAATSGEFRPISNSGLDWNKIITTKEVRYTDEDRYTDAKGILKASVGEYYEFRLPECAKPWIRICIKREYVTYYPDVAEKKNEEDDYRGGGHFIKN
jgi:hypothetical protein